MKTIESLISSIKCLSGNQSLYVCVSNGTYQLCSLTAGGHKRGITIPTNETDFTFVLNKLVNDLVCR